MSRHGRDKSAQPRLRGARFPSVAQLERWEAEERARSYTTMQAPPGPDPRAAVPAPRPSQQPDPPPNPQPSPTPSPPPEPPPAFVRPYMLTGGRTRPGRYLALETLLSARRPEEYRASSTNPTHRAVVELCEQPTSVAELAALLTLPLGVVRVLVDDLALAGELFVHRALSDFGPPDAAMLSRLLRALRKL